IVDSEIMQIIPIEFAKEMVANLLHGHIAQGPVAEQKHAIPSESKPIQTKPPVQDEYPSPQSEAQTSYHGENIIREREQVKDSRTVKVEPVQFETFEESYSAEEKRNLDLIRDVPLEITVELGRTTKRISEILEFTSGTVIELDKLAGESLDILVNGHFMAKGEVVIIDENYGVRITDILSNHKKLTKFK
ncbi:MAG TPA: flagellar motor switch protein FliN, partial [Clostridiales bacterium]|nr:flagellar motor switch protein FliN [Clostridiales bacterium]